MRGALARERVDLVERTFPHAYVSATLKRDEIIREGRNAEVTAWCSRARAPKAAGNWWCCFLTEAVSVTAVMFSGNGRRAVHSSRGRT